MLIAAVVALVLHLYLEAVDDVNVTVVPGHTLVVVAGDAVMVGAVTVA